MTKNGDDPIVDLARNLIKVSFEDLSEETLNFQKKRFLDSIGTTIAGSHARGVETIMDFFKGCGGKKESTVLFHGVKLPCQNAAFVNSVMSRAVDYCDVVLPGYHASSTDIPTALAVGEMMGSSGKDILTALTLGGDLAQRIALAGVLVDPIMSGHPYFGFDGNVVAPFGAAAIAGKLLGLNQEQMVNSFGIAINQAAGTLQSNSDGALVVRVIQGFATSSGIVSALFAKGGISGAKNVLNGPYGFYELYTRGRCNIDILTEQLGKKFYGLETTTIKGYPSCGLTLGVTDAALELLSMHNIKPEEIESITVKLSEFAYNVTGKTFTIDKNTEVDAQFSTHYVVANVFLRGYPELKHFTEQYIKEPALLNLIEKVHTEVDEALIGDEADVTVRLKNQEEYTTHKQWGKGHPPNPISDEEFKEKFWNCIEFSQLKLSTEKINKIISTVEQLEELNDIVEFIQICT